MLSMDLPTGHQLSCKKGDLFQILPSIDSPFAGCIMVVDEPKKWGALLYMDTGRGLAYFRCKYEDMMRVGVAMFVADLIDEEDVDEDE